MNDRNSIANYNISRQQIPNPSSFRTSGGIAGNGFTALGRRLDSECTDEQK